MTDIRKKTESKIKNLLKDPVLCQDQDLVTGLKDQLQSLDTREYRITVLGEFSSGKSTFLNALIGKDILPHGVEETTATVTYIHNVAPDNPKANKVVVIFNDVNRKPVQLNLSQSRTALIDFVTAKAKDTDVTKEISEVHIYIPYLSGDQRIILIDTPGLNGIKDGMRDITYREINRSHANICLFGIKGVSQSDLSFINDFYKNGTPFFFVLNQIDMLKPDEETADHRIAGFKSDIRDKILHIQETPANIFGLSALQALASRDASIKTLHDGSPELTPADRQRLAQISRIGEFEQSLYDYVNTGKIERDFLSQVNKRIDSLLTIAAEKARQEKAILEASVNDLPEKNMLEQQMHSVKKKFEDNKISIRRKLSGKMEDLEKASMREIRKICSEITAQAEDKVAGWDTLEKAETADKGKVIANFINYEIAIKREFLNIWLSSRFNQIYAEMIDVVNSFVPSVSFSDKKSGWDITFDREEAVDYSKLERIKKDIESVRGNIYSVQSKKQSLGERKRELDRQGNDKDRELESSRYQERRERSNLGYRPSYRTWTEERKVKKKILWLIPYTSTEYYTANNSSEIAEYDRKESEITQRYDAQQRAIRIAKQAITQQKNRVESDRKLCESQLQQLEAKLKMFEEQKRREEEEIEFMRRSAKTRLLKKIKEKARKIIAEALSDSNGMLCIALRDDIRQNISHAEDQMNVDLEKFYRKLIERFESQVKLIIKKFEDKADIQGQNQRITTLNKIMDHAVSALQNK